MLPITGQVHQKIVSGFTTMTSYITILAIGSWLGYSIVCAHWVPQILTCTQRGKKRNCHRGFAQIQYMSWVASYLKLSRGMKHRWTFWNWIQIVYRMVPHDIPKEEEFQECSVPSWLQFSKTIMWNYNLGDQQCNLLYWNTKKSQCLPLFSLSHKENVSVSPPAQHHATEKCMNQ
jgi:hypothetical protein